MKNTEKKFNSLLDRVDAVRKKQKRVFLFSGLFLSLAIVLLLFIIAASLEAFIHFDSTTRTVIVTLLAGTILSILILKVAKPVYVLFKKKYPADEKIGKIIGDHFPSIEDKLSNAIQVYKIKKSNPHGFSDDLIDESVNSIHEQTIKINFLESIKSEAVFRYGRLWLAVFVFYLLLVFGVGESFQNAQFRLFNPFTEFNEYPGMTIQVAPGHKQVLKNEPVEISARVQGGKIKKLDLHLKEINNEYHLTHALEANQKNEFKFIIEHIQDTTEYFLSAREITSGKYTLSVVELPIVRNLQVRISPPNYVRKGVEFLEENIGDMSCLKGSYAEIDLLSNKKLSRATLILNDKKEVPLNVTLESAAGSFKINEGGSYFLKLLDEEDFENRDPIVYRITLIEDIYPSAFITSPGQDVDLTEDLLLPLTIEAEDDFGFFSLRLGYKIIKMDTPFTDTTLKFISLPAEIAGAEKINFDYLWDLTTLDLFAGDIVRYYAEIFDNDNVSGPKSSKSQIYSARFPTLEEIFAEVDAEQEQTSESFEGLYEKSKELKENIEKLAEELKQNPELKWEEKKQVENVLENQKQLEKSLEEIQEQLEQMVERMEKNDLLSLETLQKYSELQKLLDEVMTDELKEAIKKLQQAAEKIDEQLMKQAIEQLNFAQEEFLKNIEKTLNILKRLQIEQKLDELVKKAEKLLQEQTDINEQLKKELSKNQKDGLCENQAETKNKTEDALKETEQLKDDMTEFSNMPEDMLEQMLEKMKQSGLLEKMKESISQMKSGNMQSAQQCGKSAKSSLSMMMDMLSQAKKDLIEKQKQEVMAELKRLSNNILTLSKKQESLLNQSKKLNSNSPLLTNRADTQQNLASALNRNANVMGELSNKTFFVSAQMMRSMGQSLQNMKNALTQFEGRNMAKTTRSQQKAMVSLNETLKQLRSAMKELANASSAAGLEEYLEKLSQMAGKQQGINQQTMNLNPGSQPMTMGQQAAMARLAAEQAALRKAMEQLQKEYGERSDILGRLDQIGKDMGDVAKDLQKRNVSRRTINRQQRILQRLLDAQKSARKQDYSRKRRAETGKYYPALSPGQLPTNLGEKNIRIQRDLLKALKEGYSKDYQELIKKYFEALMKESMENETTE
ncbi:hypothetical protein H8E88_30790 [candidate division KSB1 bacterium]|nr:hypothetical protein [candidate division KSB1 bacterium]